MKRFRKALGIVALALVVSLSLAMPVSAWADEAESYGKPDVSGPQSAWYNGQSHHFRSTVKDSVSGKDLVEGEDFVRSYYFMTDRGNLNGSEEWLDSDSGMASSGFVQERIPAAGSNSAKTRTGLGDADLGDGYTYKMVVGDDICGFNYIRIVPATLTIVPAYTDVGATIAWKDSSNKDGLRPSAEDYAKLLSLTADGVASDMLPAVVDNGDDTYTVTYTGVRQYAYDDNGERYDVDYKITQADVDGYTTDNATVGNEGVITNTHEVKADSAGESEDKSDDRSKDDSGNKPEEQQVASNDELAKTGDQTPSALVALALGASALGIAVVAKRRSKR